MPGEDPHRSHDHKTADYLGHFFKFIATFVIIVTLSLFLFSVTAGA